MPVMESITIINKSGKVVSTGKHLVNIFKDARDAYNDKKAELRAERQERLEYKTAQKLLNAREETRSVASSRHSHRSHRSHRSSATREAGDRSRPPLTSQNLSQISETASATPSATSSRHRRRHGHSHRGSQRSSSHHGERIRSPSSPHDSPQSYHPPYMETAIESRTELVRRHTDHISDDHDQIMTRPRPRHTSSNPDFRESKIDMNLAYGDLPHPSSLDVTLSGSPTVDQEPAQELKETMSKLDTLLVEAQCLQHSATAIITNLQANPEAMAAVALTLAELSTLIAKCSPGILTAIKSSSPIIFGLLASPQFLIAGGVAIGVTIVMFGGFKIIKKIQAQAEEKKEANRMEEAMVFEGDYSQEMSSIETWRRGIAEVEDQSVATSVDGEFITPEADRQRKELIRERKREERRERHRVAESVMNESVRSESTTQMREVPVRSSSKSVTSATVVEEKMVKMSKDGKKEKKNNALTILFKKNKEGKGKSKKDEAVKASSGHHPIMLEI